MMTSFIIEYNGKSRRLRKFSAKNKRKYSKTNVGELTLFYFNYLAVAENSPSTPYQSSDKSI